MNPQTPPATARSQTRQTRLGARFAATSWTAVVKASRPEEPEAGEALTKLCEAYWEPLHAYIRRLGYNEDDAKDLTQEFFLRLLSKNVLAAADRDKGRFRTFLLTTLNFFLKNEYHRQHAAKRGGGKVTVSLDEETEDEQPRHQPASFLSPAALYEQTWAKTVFRQAHERLAEEYSSAGKPKLFASLKAFLEGSPGSRGYHGVAAQLQMTPNAIGVAVHRMRQRLGELIRAEIGRTLVNPTAAEIEAEMRFLLETLGH